LLLGACCLAVCLLGVAAFLGFSSSGESRQYEFFVFGDWQNARR
jgi:hypothetical protein